MMNITSKERHSTVYREPTDVFFKKILGEIRNSCNSSSLTTGVLLLS